MKMIRWWLAGALAVAVNAALAADTGTLTRADAVRSKPFADAAVVLQLKSGVKVDIISRNGGWYQVKSGGKTGWVRMLSVRRAAATTGSAVTGIASVASGRTGTGKVTTTTGVRGLDEAELKAAAFDEAQIAKAEGYRASRQEADAFAAAGKLVRADVQPLPAPAKN